MLFRIWTHKRYPIHWNENLVIFTKFSSLAALKVVILTTCNAASDENFVKMTSFTFHCTSPCQVSYGAFFPSSLKKRYSKISRVHYTVYMSGCTSALPNDSLEPFLCHTKGVHAIITLITWQKMELVSKWVSWMLHLGKGCFELIVTVSWLVEIHRKQYNMFSVNKNNCNLLSSKALCNFVILLS